MPHPTITLIDGRVVSTWSQEWLEECGARHKEAKNVLGMATREIRQRHADTVYRERIEAQARVNGWPDPPACADRAVERLKAEVLALWQRRRDASMQ